MSDTQLADFCASIDYGYTTSACSEAVGPRFLRVTDIVGGPPQWEDVPYCEADEKAAAKFKLNDGDIVVARTGATTGVSAYIQSPPAAVFASYLVRLVVDTSVADVRFISYYLKGPQFWGYMRGVLGDKSAQPNASAKTITQAPATFPKPDEQRAIANVLGALDDKIEQNRRTAQALEKLARAIFRAWFVDFEPVKAKAEGKTSFPSMPQPVFDALPTTFVDSDLGPVPEGWEVGHLGDIVIIHDSRRIPLSKREREKRHGSFRYYGATGILDWVDNYLFDGEFVLVGEDGTVVNENDHPIVQYVWGKFWVNNHAHVLTGVDGVSTEYLKLLLNQVNIRPFITGAVQPKLNQHNMKSVPVVIPCGNAVSAIDEPVAPIFSLIRQLHDESSALTSMRDYLLPKLLSGSIRVGDAERAAATVA